MTLLAEALAERKQALVDVRTLAERLQSAAVRFENDDPDARENPRAVKDEMLAAIGRYGDLTVKINLTNNTTVVKFDGREMTIMEAVTLREQLKLEASHLRSTADHVQEVLQPRHRYGRNRTKEDIREVADVPAKEFQRMADEASEKLRRLDAALQQANWTTEVVE